MRRTELTRSFLIAIAGIAFYSGPAGADDQPIAIAEIKRDTPVDFEGDSAAFEAKLPGMP